MFFYSYIFRARNFPCITPIWRKFKHFLNILKIIVCSKIDCRQDTEIVIKERSCIGVTSHECPSWLKIGNIQQDRWPLQINATHIFCGSLYAGQRANVISIGERNKMIQGFLFICADRVWKRIKHSRHSRNII